MSITVRNLTKVYGSRAAVDNVSFQIGRGEVVGFLGPNGAGKSTTMKILTGYLPPTEGSVLVCDQEVSQQRSVRKTIGYLPEHNPLYLDMYVHEFLDFVGKVYGIHGSSLKKRVAEIVEQCGLTIEQNKKIEMLSKGYRQRVGLAQALLHDPQVLILDEPTTGLDPNQIVEIRQLIKSISANKTVLFSTHIMQEVQALCDRAIVINKGTIVADATIKDLVSRNEGVKIFVAEFETPIATTDLLEIEGVDDVQELTPSSFKLITNSGTDIRPSIFRFAADKNLSLLGLRQEENSLESVFRDLTKSPSA
ncbi:MAG TPA: gliding motility-associated ABC transporter ATP-binding subunit GldA [Cyclobacteriaceae bacterium]|nr:gliding motility-associated ABC transporter ATP-binding subunit GldA [Cyclobacteriaceae bacterium]